MLHKQAAPLAALAVALTALTARAQSPGYVAILNNQNEPPAGVTPTLQNGQPRPASFGTATFVFNDARTALTMVANVFNIDVTGTQTPDPNDNLTNAHIHAGSDPNAPTFGVVWGFHGSPQHDTVQPERRSVVPFATGVGGTFTATWDAAENNGALATNIPNIDAGRAYINFHTVQFAPGEIRGTLVVPEPGSIALLALGALTLTTRRRRNV